MKKINGHEKPLVRVRIVRPDTPEPEFEDPPPGPKPDKKFERRPHKRENYQNGRPAHWFKKGQRANPKGRPKGTLSKFTLKQYFDAKAAGELPLHFMLRVMRDEDNPTELRLRAACDAAPYLHRKMPIGIEQSPGRFGSLTPDQLRQLPTPALQSLLAASQSFQQQLAILGVIKPEGRVIEVVPS